MKLMRFGERSGKKIPCVLDSDGKARNVSSIVSDFGPQTLSPHLIGQLRAAGLSELPMSTRMDNASLRL